MYLRQVRDKERAQQEMKRNGSRYLRDGPSARGMQSLKEHRRTIEASAPGKHRQGKCGPCHRPAEKCFSPPILPLAPADRSSALAVGGDDGSPESDSVGLH